VYNISQNETRIHHTYTCLKTLVALWAGVAFLAENDTQE